jgi:hypothetical protein
VTQQLLRLTRRKRFKNADERLANIELILTKLVEQVDEDDQRVGEVEAKLSRLLLLLSKAGVGK